MSNTDNINHPNHYTWHPSGVECIETVRDPLFCLKTAWVYLWRCNHKGTFESDVNKALLYLQWALESPPAEWVIVSNSCLLWAETIRNYLTDEELYNDFYFTWAMKRIAMSADDAGQGCLQDALISISLTIDEIKKSLEEEPKNDSF